MNPAKKLLLTLLVDVCKINIYFCFSYRKSVIQVIRITVMIPLPVDIYFLFKFISKLKAHGIQW